MPASSSHSVRTNLCLTHPEVGCKSLQEAEYFTLQIQSAFATRHRGGATVQTRRLRSIKTIIFPFSASNCTTQTYPHSQASKIRRQDHYRTQPGNINNRTLATSCCIYCAPQSLATTSQVRVFIRI